jgi:hypothetical protein
MLIGIFWNGALLRVWWLTRPVSKSEFLNSK